MKSILLLLDVVFLLVISWFGFGIYQQVNNEGPVLSSGEAAAVDSAPSREKEKEHPLSDYSVVWKRNLFVVADSQKQPPQMDLSNLKETELALKLWGTVSGQGGVERAVIEDKKTGQQSLYREGDAIQEAEVSMILREKVVLNVNGRSEILAIEEIENQKGGPPQTPPAVPHEAPPSPPVNQGNMPLPGMQVELKLKADMIDDLIQKTPLENQATLTAKTGDEKESGVEISRIKASSVYRRLGLRNGDTLLEMNGEKMVDAAGVQKVVNSLSQEEEINITLNRGGKEITRHYSLN